MTALKAAAEYVERGFFPIPVPHREKKPVLEGWPNLRLARKSLPHYFNGTPSNIGVLLGDDYGTTDVDLDCPEALVAAAELLPPTGMIFGRRSKPRSHHFYRCDPPVRAKRYSDPLDKKSCLVELRCQKADGSIGLQTIVPPSTHRETGEPILFEPGFGPRPSNIDSDVLVPAVDKVAAAALLARHWPAKGRHNCELALAGALARAGWSLEDARAFVLAAYRAVPSHDRGAYGRVEQSVGSTYEKHRAGDPTTGKTSLTDYIDKRVVRTALSWLGIQQGPAPATKATETEAPHFSEDSLAGRFTQRHGDNLRYVAAWGRWLQWDGTRWTTDDTLHVFDRARQVCRAASAEPATKTNITTRVASAATVAAVERLVRADRRHAAVVGQWDADPWLLNTPGGIVDLRTGGIQVHRRDAYCTKMTAVAPGGSCLLWDAFLDRVTDGDRDLRAFLSRMAGYCLTADTREHALFFLYGTGANGKSVFLSTVANILNDYAKSAAIETFIASPSEHHPTDLAGLQGARLVTAVETEDGRRWAESKIKILTGGDRISARFMRQDFFEFTPVFKLVIAGNHKPGLRSVDEAVRRRLHLIPFTVTIPKAERDLCLTQKLRTEWPGILGWALAGCLEWQAQGLNPPASVRDATEAYMAAEDGLAQWLDERCVRLPNDVTAVKRLFEDWKAWAEPAGEYIGSQRRFSQAIEERGFARARLTGGTRAFQGIALRAPEDGGAQ